MVGAVILAALAFLPARASAHSGATLTIHSDGTGAVWVTAQWQDGHPVTGQIAAALTATPPAGDRVGPVPLRPSADRPGALALDNRLAPGNWSVEVDMASPAIGHCATEVAVAAELPARATEVRCGDSPPPARSESSAPLFLTPPGSYVLIGGLFAVAFGLAVAVHRERLRAGRH
jgi:hypothetical protein